jgi:Homeodomain-like domain
MTRPYSVDLRERVVRAVEAGLSRRAAARRFEVSVSFVIKLLQRWQRQGTVQPERYGGWKRAILAPMPRACTSCCGPSRISPAPSCAAAGRPKRSTLARRRSAGSSPPKA